MKHQKTASRDDAGIRRSISPLVSERARETLAVLEELFSSLDCLRVAGEASGDHSTVGEARIVKERIAESYALRWLHGLSTAPVKKTKRKPSETRRVRLVPSKTRKVDAEKKMRALGTEPGNQSRHSKRFRRRP